MVHKKIMKVVETFFDKVGSSKTSVDKDYKLPHLIEVNHFS